MNKYGRYIREIREKNNDKLEDLAKKLDMTLSALSKIELGQRKVTPELLEQVADIYEVPLSYFFGEEATVPKELKEVGVEWIAFAKEMKQKELTPEQIKATLELLERLNAGK